MNTGDCAHDSTNAGWISLTLVLQANIEFPLQILSTMNVWSNQLTNWPYRLSTCLQIFLHVLLCHV
jgi:hypothetical protein